MDPARIHERMKGSLSDHLGIRLQEASPERAARARLEGAGGDVPVRQRVSG